jgi:magnesium chelatase family protein
MSTNGFKGPKTGQTCAFSLRGLAVDRIQIEAIAEAGPASFQLVGLPEARVRDTRVRVRAALQQVGVDLAAVAITVRLEPADAAKSGPLDLAIAMAVLAALGHVSAESLAGTLLLGELSLTGAIRPVRGILPLLQGAATAGLTCAVVPLANAAEAANVTGLRVLVAEHLSELVRHFNDGSPLESVGRPPAFSPSIQPGTPDLSDVRGQFSARRALEIAAAGGHSLLMIGPPGGGKTMLARRLPGILPPLRLDEALEVTAIHSVAGLLPAERGLLVHRPFRAPHHTVSAAGLVGGGDPARPGEVSLAHHGCLFLDELLEFRRPVLEALRQPLDDGQVTVCRSRGRAIFPARPLLVAAVNPCPCGFAGETSRRCTCTPERRQVYRTRLSSPVFDLFDLHVVLPPVEVSHLQGTARGEASREVQQRVIAARALQTERAKARSEVLLNNARLSRRELEHLATPDAGGTRLLSQAVERLGLSALQVKRALRVARTIADLDGTEDLHAPHIAEAIEGVALSPPSSSSTSP